MTQREERAFKKSKDLKKRIKKAQREHIKMSNSRDDDMLALILLALSSIFTSQ